MFDTYDEIFQQRADAYHAAMAQYPRARDAEFDFALELARPQAGQVICDAPAGGGYLREYLPNDIAAYIAVENAPDFIRACPFGDNNQLVECPLDALALDDGSVDTLLSVAAAHHLPSKPDFFTEVHRVLKPGGRFVLLDVDAGTPVAQFLNVYVHEHNSMGHVGDFLDQQSSSTVAASGFEVEVDEVRAFPWRFDTRDDLARYCQLLFGIDQATTPEVGDRAIELLGECEGPGNVNLRWTLRGIAARKPG